MEGALVVVADMNRQKSELAANAIQKATGGRALGIAMDVTDEDAVERGVKAAVREYGVLHILCSNAGVQHIAGSHELAYRDLPQFISMGPF
jgi:3-hydroxybutyrate dehydrogenase